MKPAHNGEINKQKSNLEFLYPDYLQKNKPSLNSARKYAGKVKWI